MKKNNARIRRATKSRASMASLGKTRLSIHRSNTNIYAQVIDGETNKIIASASTLEAEVKKKLKNTSNTDAATDCKGFTVQCCRKTCIMEPFQSAAKS